MLPCVALLRGQGSADPGPRKSATARPCPGQGPRPPAVDPARQARGPVTNRNWRAARPQHRRERRRRAPRWPGRRRSSASARRAGAAARGHRRRPDRTARSLRPPGASSLAEIRPDLLPRAADCVEVLRARLDGHGDAAWPSRPDSAVVPQRPGRDAGHLSSPSVFADLTDQDRSLTCQPPVHEHAFILRDVLNIDQHGTAGLRRRAARDRRAGGRGRRPVHRRGPGPAERGRRQAGLRLEQGLHGQDAGRLQGAGKQPARVEGRPLGFPSGLWRPGPAATSSNWPSGR